MARPTTRKEAAYLAKCSNEETETTQFSCRLCVHNSFLFDKDRQEVMNSFFPVKLPFNIVSMELDW